MFHSILPPRYIFVERIIDHPKIRQVAVSQTYFLHRTDHSIELALDEAKWTNLNLLIALGHVDEINTLQDN